MYTRLRTKNILAQILIGFTKKIMRGLDVNIKLLLVKMRLIPQTYKHTVKDEPSYTIYYC